MSTPPATNEQIPSIMDDWEKLIAAAPEEPQPVRGAGHAARPIAHCTNLPKRYRAEWPRPTDGIWLADFSRVMAKIDGGGIIALIGPRGTGKTRLAAEAIRNHSPDKAIYTTAMALFLRIRASFAKMSRESEDEIVRELSKAPLLILDEIQERGNTPWEDRLLTHILDRRYGDMTPTIVIANLTEAALIECLGDSIISRLTETGGVLEIAGRSYRDPQARSAE